MENILVIGANGNTGRIINEFLKKSAKYKPYAMIRKEDQKPYFQNQGIETRYGDLEEDFSNALKGMDKVIFAAGSGGSTGNDKTLAVDEKGAIKSIESAIDNQIQKFVMLSTMGTDNPDQIKGLEQYLRSKKIADDKLRKSGLVYTIVQPGGLTNDQGTEKVEIAKKLGKFGKIPREDVAKGLIYSLEMDIASNSSFEMISGDALLKETLENYNE